MLLYLLVQSIVDNLTAFLNGHAFDLHLDSNNILQIFAAYMRQGDYFFPITDAYLPIAITYTSVYVFLVLVRIFGIAANLLRGSGAKI